MIDGLTLEELDAAPFRELWLEEQGLTEANQPRVPAGSNGGWDKPSWLGEPLEEFDARQPRDHSGKWTSAGGSYKGLKRVEKTGSSGGDFTTDTADHESINYLYEANGQSETFKPDAIDALDTGDGTTVFVYHGPDGERAGRVVVADNIIVGPGDSRRGGDVEWGSAIESVRVFESKRGQGLGTRMYDQLQDQGHVDLYGAIGQAHSFTSQGRTFALSWLQHRVDLERQREYAATLGTQLGLGMAT